MFDSLSPLALSCYGATEARLPHLDGIAAQGTVYHEHYGLWEPRENVVKSGSHILQQLEQQGVKVIARDEVGNLPPESDCPQLLWWPISADAVSLEVWDRQLGEWQNLLTTLGRKACWIITAGEGGTALELDCSWADAYATSLTRKLWSPLVVAEAGGKAAFHKRSSGLTDSAQIEKVISQYLGLQESPNQTSEISGQTELLIEDETRFGWRTAEFLLTIAKAEMKSLPDEEIRYAAALYQKPDDRFDLNNLATVYPEETERLYAQLKERLAAKAM